MFCLQTSGIHVTCIKIIKFRYSKEFGFTIQGRDIIVDDIRVRAVGLTDKDSGQDLEIADSKIPDCKIVNQI